MSKQAISIVWFKRDLRLIDNEALYCALQAQHPVLLLYIFEPSVMAYPDSDVRHWRFVWESLLAMNTQLEKINARVYVFQNEANLVFEKLKLEMAKAS